MNSMVERQQISMVRMTVLEKLFKLDQESLQISILCTNHCAYLFSWTQSISVLSFQYIYISPYIQWPLKAGHGKATKCLRTQCFLRAWNKRQATSTVAQNKLHIVQVQNEIVFKCVQCDCVTACWRCLLCNWMSLWFGTCDRETRPRTMPLPLLSTSKLPLQVLHQNAYFCKSPVHRESKQMHRMIYKHPWVVTLKPGQLEVPSREQSWSNDPSSEAYPCGSVPVHLAVLCIWAHVIDQNKSLLNL